MSKLIQLLSRPIAYQPAFADLQEGKIRSGTVGAVFLSQMVYWHNKMGGNWFYKTREEITAETFLSRNEQETARKRLVALGVLEEQRKGVPGKIHYRVNAERLEHLLLYGDEGQSEEPDDESPESAEPPQSENPTMRESNNVENPPTRLRESNQQYGGDPALFLTGDYTEDYTGDYRASAPPENSTDAVSEKKRRRKTALKSPVAEFDFSSFPTLPSDQVWGDYVKHRKAKRAPITQTVVNILGQELTKAVNAGWTVDQALGEAMAAGWQGLKFEWLANRNNPVRSAGTLNRQEALEARNAQIFEEWLQEEAQALDCRGNSDGHH
ncbi:MULTISPECIES: hypothetical protein [unclassified Brenneria]|uniref:hypothetical protein n=1 Tax=unclassified Brenneria TaxID=2634434 RepID=UPI0015530E23|nr:hypothetical protein [Brenneria sp. hezel4-2-4]MEE3649484.1 hypothetical protein [Brenneria sp. HEZEL_4_2_4]NPC99440.1 hypothetical protein [Brenneria sp. hezel4-2-4]